MSSPDAASSKARRRRNAGSTRRSPDRDRRQGTGLCAPLEPTFRNWLDGIWKHRVSPCGGEGFPVYLTQAVQSAEFPVPLVAGDSALLRVFPTAPEGAVVDFPPVKAYISRGHWVTVS